MGACIYKVENLKPILDTVDEQPVGLDVALAADHASAPACTTCYVYAERYPRGTSRNHSTFVRWAVMV